MENEDVDPPVQSLGQKKAALFKPQRDVSGGRDKRKLVKLPRYIRKPRRSRR